MELNLTIQMTKHKAELEINYKINWRHLRLRKMSKWKSSFVLPCILRGNFWEKWEPGAMSVVFTHGPFRKADLSCVCGEPACIGGLKVVPPGFEPKLPPWSSRKSLTLSHAQWLPVDNRVNRRSDQREKNSTIKFLSHSFQLFQNALVSSKIRNQIEDLERGPAADDGGRRVLTFSSHRQPTPRSSRWAKMVSSSRCL